MKKYMWLFVMLLVFYSCNPADDSNANTSTQVTKISQVDESAKKVEVTLPSINGKVTFSSSSSLQLLRGKSELTAVTVYRWIKQDGVKSWHVDNINPQVLVDSVLIVPDRGTLEKLEYRQGFISAIYK